jgi:pimeloyl-ACP methyl ester carboxylesterase
MTDTTAPPAAGATTPDTGLADHVQRADANGIEIAYETFGDPADPAILLVMGLGTQMLAWRDDMCTALADAGHFVIRYDNRDVGLSTHIDAPVPKLTDMVLKRGAPYSIADMANDAFGLLDALGIDRFHLVGASMGGMIAQTIALAQPRRVLTLTLIMTSTGSRKVGRPTPAVMKRLATQAEPTDREAAIEGTVATYRVIGSPAHLDEDNIRELAGKAYDRSHNPAGRMRQLAAIRRGARAHPHAEPARRPQRVQRSPLRRADGGPARRCRRPPRRGRAADRRGARVLCRHRPGGDGGTGDGPRQLRRGHPRLPRAHRRADRVPQAAGDRRQRPRPRHRCDHPRVRGPRVHEHRRQAQVPVHQPRRGPRGRLELPDPAAGRAPERDLDAAQLRVGQRARSQGHGPGVEAHRPGGPAPRSPSPRRAPRRHAHLVADRVQAGDHRTAPSADRGGARARERRLRGTAGRSRQPRGLRRLRRGSYAGLHQPRASTGAP